MPQSAILAGMDDVIELAGALNPRSGWAADACSIAKALEVVSTRSAFLLMREAFYGTTRFDDFAERAQISEPAAAARLRELVDEGLLTREAYREPGQRTRNRYRLTGKGADLFPVLVALMEWGDRWVADAGGPVALRHRGCGELAGVQLRCAAGHEVSPEDLELVMRRRTPKGVAGGEQSRKSG
jgi:DNA-binding HxlR family transcriptional regulator